VSFFANNYSKFPAPDLVKLVVSDIEILDETERVAKQKAKKEEAQRKQKEYEDKWRREHQCKSCGKTT
jgi:hypothetical protein